VKSEREVKKPAPRAGADAVAVARGCVEVAAALVRDRETRGEACRASTRRTRRRALATRRARHERRRAISASSGSISCAKSTSFSPLSKPTVTSWRPRFSRAERIVPSVARPSTPRWCAIGRVDRHRRPGANSKSMGDLLSESSAAFLVPRTAARSLATDRSLLLPQRRTSARVLARIPATDVKTASA